MVPAKEALALLTAFVLLNCHALIVRLPLTCTMRRCIFHIFAVLIYFLQTMIIIIGHL